MQVAKPAVGYWLSLQGPSQALAASTCARLRSFQRCAGGGPAFPARDGGPRSFPPGDLGASTKRSGGDLGRAAASSSARLASGGSIDPRELHALAGSGKRTFGTRT